MTYHNFILADVVAISEAFLLYALFLFVPGYVISAALDLLEFRRQTLFLKSVTAVAVSCALSPVIAYLAWTVVSLTLVWIIFATLWCGFLFLILKRFLSRDRGVPFGADRASWMILTLAFAWVLLALFSLIDLQFGDRLYRSVTDFDHCMRTAVVSSISRTGLPPRTPFFYPGQPVLLRSHYFWLVLSSLVQLLGHGHISARDAMLASPLWCGMALLATICLYLRFFFEKPLLTAESALQVKALAWKRKSIIAGALIAVTGLDILPTIYFYLSRHVVFADMEWWNEQITSWFDSMLWVPHHVAALLAALTGFLILFRGVGKRVNRNVVLALVAGLAFACCAGTSVYVGFVFALFASFWCLALASQKSWRELGTLLLAGIVALACLLPFITEASSAAGGGSFIEFKIRSFSLVDIFLVNHQLTDPWMVASAHLLFMPANYLFEFGIFFLVGAWRLRRYIKSPRCRTHAESCALLMFMTGLLVSMFLRSSAISNNDLGWRSCLIVQFICLLWAPDLILALFSNKKLGATKPPNRALWFFWRVTAYVFIVLGLAGSIYQVVVLRYYAPLVDANVLPPVDWLAPDHNSGKRSYAAREAYEWLRKNTPTNTIEQHDPLPWYDDPFWGMYGDRQTVANNAACGVALGGTPAACSTIVPYLIDLFRNPSLDPAQVDATCRQFKIDVLIAKDRDIVWNYPNSWVWKKTPLFSNDYIRAFSCH